MVAPLKVGIAGLGTVGAEVVRLIENEGQALSARCGRGVRVVAVTARSKAKKRGLDLRGIDWAKSPLALAEHPNIDCFVELMGGAGEPALSAVETALKAGKSVVTANKALIARHGLRLAQAAEKHGGALNFEAAVGAAIPVIKTLREGLAGTGINRVYGILNGTCNYILTRMEQEGLSFAECLKDAQRLGYAEANPSFDVDGHDTAQKLAILASLAFGTKVAQSAVYVEGISSIAPEDLRAASDLGYRVKLLGVAVQHRQRHRAARASDHGAEILLDRAGDGRDQCGHHRRRGHSADHAGRPGRRWCRDRIRRARRHRRCRARRPRQSVRPAGRAPARHREGADGTARGRLLHPPDGARSRRHRGDHRDAARRAEDFDRIDRAASPQWRRRAKAAGKASPVPVLLITYATHEDAVHRALAAVQRDKVISGRPQVIRIEKN